MRARVNQGRCDSHPQSPIRSTKFRDVDHLHLAHSVYSARGPAPPPRAGMLRELAPGYRAVVGLTGSIASGKSHARDHLARLGAVTIDADRLGHAAYRRGTACYDAVVREFGAEIVGADGACARTDARWRRVSDDGALDGGGELPCVRERARPVAAMAGSGGGGGDLHPATTTPAHGLALARTPPPQPPRALRAVHAAGEVDRRLLGPLVFASPARLQALNAIVWPAIESAIVQALRDEAARVTADAAAAAGAAGLARHDDSGCATSASPGQQPPQHPPLASVDGGLVAVVEAAVLLEAGWGDKVRGQGGGGRCCVRRRRGGLRSRTPPFPPTLLPRARGDTWPPPRCQLSCPTQPFLV